MMEVGRPLIREELGEKSTDQALKDSDAHFQNLLPDIPYIGGRDNPLTDTIIQMTSMLALYRALKGHLPVNLIGELTCRMAQAWIDRYPRVLRHLIGRYYLSRFMQQRKREQARASLERRYPGDFVFEYVEGDGGSFDWGINYLDCAVVKFFADQGASELTPFMCRIDFLMFPALGITLRRTSTRARGCSHCDFRFQWGGAAAELRSSGWGDS
jgi:hypothetical protein